ncbi:MAG: TIGR00295 family protein [Methanomicrobiales archaeon]
MYIELLRESDCSKEVIEHSQAVADKALEISKKFNPNISLVKTGALLHDIGRGKTHGIKHAVVGARILRNLGFSQKLINIVERHIGAGIPLKEAKLLGLPPKNYMPITLEEKIVAHADNLINGTREVDIEFVVCKWKSQLGNDHPGIHRLIKLHQELIEENISII